MRPFVLPADGKAVVCSAGVGRGREEGKARGRVKVEEGAR